MYMYMYMYMYVYKSGLPYSPISTANIYTYTPIIRITPITIIY